MAETLIGQFVLTPLFQLTSPTTLGFIRVRIQPQQIEMPLGWGYEFVVVSLSSGLVHPRTQIFPWGGPSGTEISQPTIVRLPISPGLPKVIGVRSIRQIGIPVDVFAGNETDYF